MAVTTVQIGDETLELLRKVKKDTHSTSYDEAIRQIVGWTIKEKSLCGYLGSKPSRQLLKDLRDKHERF
ncbi:hypothetical protein HZC30_05655 [Candidatus Woesearchaeota archaeon]|nr:hypothetical protein [Candidatus Woesearchaeota archaeon]